MPRAHPGLSASAAPMIQANPVRLATAGTHTVATENTAPMPNAASVRTLPALDVVRSSSHRQTAYRKSGKQHTRLGGRIQ